MNNNRKGTLVEINNREILVNGEPVMVEKGTLHVSMGGPNDEPMRVTMTLLPVALKVGTPHSGMVSTTLPNRI